LQEKQPEKPIATGKKRCIDEFPPTSVSAGKAPKRTKRQKDASEADVEGKSQALPER
jgi:hypothetical protein